MMKARPRFRRWLAALVPAGALLAAFVASPPPASADTPAPKQGVNNYSGMCMDIRWNSTVDFNPVQMYTCNGTGAQQWIHNTDNTLRSAEDGRMCLDVAGGGTANGTPVDLYQCNGTGAQQWVNTGNRQWPIGLFAGGELYNPQSGKCLDDTNWSRDPGTQLQIWDCTGNSNQLWQGRQ